MKLTRHNGRGGAGGVYSSKHNDREFNTENTEHIDAERAARNIYWDCRDGFHPASSGQDPGDGTSFDDVEKTYYESVYADFIRGQNARNEKNRHPERNRSADDLRTDRKTCPEETIYQIGTMDEHVTPDILFEIVNEYMEKFTELFGDHVKILDLALHVDKATPHIHERHVFECRNQYGELCPRQEKALEELGFDLPDPDKKPGRYNNRKISFDAACRTMLFDICREHGLKLDEEPEYGGRKYLEKQEYIRQKQKEEIAEDSRTISTRKDEITEADRVIERKNEEIDELSMKIEDVEALLDDVSEAAYDKAVEVVSDMVSDRVREQTRDEDLAVIADYQKRISQPDSGMPPHVVKTINAVLNDLRMGIKKAAAGIQKAAGTVMRRPEVRAAGIGSVKDAARESVLKKLKDGRDEISRRDQERRAADQARKIYKKHGDQTL